MIFEPLLEDRAAKRIFSVLPESYFVGGCVRDVLMGQKIEDIDLCTKTYPQQAMECLQEENIKVLPTGIKHGTLTAVLEGRRIQITTLRKDVVNDGRHAKVVFTDNIKADALRRDLTINALYLSPDGQLFDPCGKGIEDARSGCVRFIGDAGTRIQEDYLRLLRYYRFFSRFSKIPPDTQTLFVTQKLAFGLSRLSGERLHDELFRLFCTPRAPWAIALMQEKGIMRAFWRGSDVAIDHITWLYKHNSDLVPELVLRVWIGEGRELEAIAKRFALSRQSTHRLTRALPKLEADLRKTAYLYGQEETSDAAWLARDKAAAMQVAALTLPLFPLSGQDLLNQGFSRGPKLGALLGTLETLWINEGFKGGKKDWLYRACEMQN